MALRLAVDEAYRWRAACRRRWCPAVAVVTKRMALLRPAGLSHRYILVLRAVAWCNVALVLCSVIRRWAGGGCDGLSSRPAAWWGELRTMGGSGPAPSSLCYTFGAGRRLGFCCRRGLPTVVACYIPDGLLQWQQLGWCAWWHRGTRVHRHKLHSIVAKRWSICVCENSMIVLIS